jgi:pimeloyl-ACP methyl ester carboxylesterase
MFPQHILHFSKIIHSRLNHGHLTKQGGALAASLLLKHQIENPFDPPPFRLAIFLCASLPFSWTAEHGFDVTTLMLLGQAATGDFAQWQHASAQKPATPSDSTLLSLPIQQRVQAQKRIEALRGSSNESCLYRRFHPEDGAKTRIQIPTVHVIGARDEMFREQSVKLAELCDERMAETVTHAKGHEVPREACQDIARAIQEAATRAEFMV